MLFSQTTWLVNMINVLFWFIIKPDGPADSIKTIITSMAAVLTVSMSLRIILSIHGSLDYGGNFSLTTGTFTSSRTTHVSNARSGNLPVNHSAPNGHYTLDDLGTKPESEWISDGKGIVSDNDTVLKSGLLARNSDFNGVKVTVDKEIGYDGVSYAK